jgi:D-psicose/D-tagatose/L-ribulose 3-epimerase
MNIEESGFFSPVLAAGDRLGYVHIGENHRGYHGSGTVDFDAFFRSLDVIEYDGLIVLSPSPLRWSTSHSAGAWQYGAISGTTPTA